MEGEMRREQLVQLLKQASAPVSGTDLAKRLGVSRQVIVQDIALLRAVNKNILSTNKGYILYAPETSIGRVKRNYAVSHTKEEIRDELYTIVDCGGKVLDVVVEHDIYGQITADLILCNRLDVDEFVERIENSKSRPLKVLTDGEHWHTVEADSERMLDKIEEELKKKGYLR